MWQLSPAASWLVVACVMGLAAALVLAFRLVDGRYLAAVEREETRRVLAALPRECFDVGQDWLSL